MGRRFYTVPFDAVTVAAAQDLFEITPADDKPIAIYGITLDNVAGVADAGDAQEELLRLAVIRGFTSSGSGGTAPTPVALDGNDTAAGFTAEVNNTTLANTGTTTQPWSLGWNTRVPLREFLPEEAWIYAAQGNTTIVVRLVTAPADGFAASGTLWVAELI